FAGPRLSRRSTAAVVQSANSTPTRRRELAINSREIVSQNSFLIPISQLVECHRVLSGAEVKQTVRKLGGLIRGPELRTNFRALRSTKARKISEIGLPHDVFRLTREFSHGLQDFCIRCSRSRNSTYRNPAPVSFNLAAKSSPAF